MSSPYLEAKEKYNTLTLTSQFTCQADLGLEEYERPLNTGSSASGMILGRGSYHNIPVFIKIFPMPCNYRYIETGGRIIRRKRVEVDKNALEIGITKLLSDLLIQSSPFTQNLLMVYGVQHCPTAFEAKISACTQEPLPPSSSYLIPQEGSPYPQMSLWSAYNEHLWDDRVNFMVVESADGDLETLFGLLMDHPQKERFLSSLMLQIILTLAMLDELLGGFYHNDLGPRNILYTVSPTTQPCYFHYRYHDVDYYIEHVGIIPKLWDFSYVYMTPGLKERLIEGNYLSYLRPEDEVESVIPTPLPCVVQLCTQLMQHPRYVEIADTELGEKLAYLANQAKDDYNVCIQLFDTYQKEEGAIQLEPSFNFP